MNKANRGEEMIEVRILTAGEQGIVVEFGNAIDAKINARVHQAARRIQNELSGFVREVVPTYRSLLVYFDPLKIKRAVLSEKIEALLRDLEEVEGAAGGRVVRIPVCYGEEFGPDLAFVAEHNKLTPEEVVKIHSEVRYQVYMLGFTPGFPYLGGMSERIATPRLAQPRTVIPAGSVGIAGAQTGLYPIESPGGWQLIGRTPVRAFQPGAEQPFLFAAGDHLQFEPITKAEYEIIAQAVLAGEYQTVIGDGEETK